ncbi:hypothetical protein [Cytobacillus sp. IB215665]|uniref:hypothetical protein n=1 Tax=Cytobacillus sp. IB215665 TaxID=3097357 RepID=UPI002A0E8442|nr:hypothetical protein [Cytobacillus sp. IB215665]MDX8367872.1 hypothetical protein [Cytobacillus sp. IB215665]
MTHEVPKRLSPKKEVLRELYLKSGNQCAFPGCTEFIMDMDGEIIGQICHIEAAMPGGQRFNTSQENEDRRDFPNLILLCPKHHKITDNVDKYSVQDLKDMKKEHEQKFSDIVSKLQNSIKDHTVLQNYSYTECCKKLSDQLGFGHSEEQLKEDSKVLNKLVDQLRKLAPDSLNLFAIMIQRSDPMPNSLDYCGEVIIKEITQATGESFNVIADHCVLLEKYGLTTSIDWDEDVRTHVLRIKTIHGVWDFWNDLTKYCKMTDIPLEEFVVNLNFAKLD